VIDHDRYTGEPRGLLCRRCNGGLGMLEDCPIRMEAALGYLAGRRSLEQSRRACECPTCKARVVLEGWKPRPAGEEEVPS